MKYYEMIEKIENSAMTEVFNFSNILVCESDNLISKIVEKLNQHSECSTTVVENKVDSIRLATSEIRATTHLQVFIFLDVDTSSAETKNALLKTCEDNSHKIMILCTRDLNSIPETLTSRCQVHRIDPMASQEIEKYLKDENMNVDSQLISFINNVDEIHQDTNFQKYLEMSEKLLTSFKAVSLSNILKSSKQIKTSKNNGEFDVSILFNVISSSVREKMITNTALPFRNLEDCHAFLEELSELRGKLMIRSINKLFVYDELIIRGYSLWNYQS